MSGVRNRPRTVFEAWLDKKSLSRTTFCNLMGIQRETLSRWEHGHGKPDARNILKFGRLFDNDLEMLLDGTGPHYDPEMTGALDSGTEPGDYDEDIPRESQDFDKSDLAQMMGDYDNDSSEEDDY